MPQQPVDDRDQPAKAHRDSAKQRHQPAGGLLQRRRLGSNGRKGAANPADCGLRSCLADTDHPLPKHHKSPGEDLRRCLAMRLGRQIEPLIPIGQPLEDRRRLTGQSRFVNTQQITRDQHAVRGKPVPLPHQYDVVGDEFSRRHEAWRAIPDHLGIRLSKFAQGGQGALAARLLGDHQPDRGGRGGDQEHAFTDIAQDQVKDGGAEHQQEHRLAQRLPQNRQDAAAGWRGQFVGPEFCEPARGLSAAQPLKAARRGDIAGVGHERILTNCPS